MTRKDWLTGFGGLLAGIILTYTAFYFQGGLERRQRIADDLADFYSAAAAEFYAARATAAAKDDAEPSNYADLYRLEDQHYQEFVSASTRLAAEVPPGLRNRVLGIEDQWQGIDDLSSDETETAWFKSLDGIRADVLDALAYSRWSDPVWKWRQ